MTQVLIVSKTRMNNGLCVSGLNSSHKNIRLKPLGRKNQDTNTQFKIGQVWDIDYQEDTNTEPPHVEDVIVTSQKYLGTVSNMRQALLSRVQPWKGSPRNLFDNMITISSNGKAFIPQHGPIPSCSTGYWIPDKPLTLYKDPEREGYYYQLVYTHSFRGSQTLTVKFVGLEPPITEIEAGTLVRVSLARWFQPYPDIEPRCYLQISGWYI